MNPEKVVLQDPGKQRRGRSPREGRASAPQTGTGHALELLSSTHRGPGVRGGREPRAAARERRNWRGGTPAARRRRDRPRTGPHGETCAEAGQGTVREAPNAGRGVAAGRPPPLPAPRAASHRRSSSTLSSCRFPDCTPWVPGRGLRLVLRLRPPRSTEGEEGWGADDGGGPAGKGGLQGGGWGGAPAALGAAGPRARRGEVAAPTRGTAEGEGSQAKTPPLAAGPGRAHWGLHGGGKATAKERGLFGLRIGSLPVMNNLRRKALNAVVKGQRRADFHSAIK